MPPERPADAPSRTDLALLEEIDNPVERLKLLAGSHEEIAKYLDAIEVSSPREREMLTEISRTRPIARPDQFPTTHRNVVEALESLARHGYRGSRAAGALGPFAAVIRYGVQLVARYVVVSYVRSVTTSMRNLYGLREIQAVPDSPERIELNRARTDAERMVEALKAREIGVPTFVIAGVLLPIVASVGSATGVLTDEWYAGGVGLAGVVFAFLLSWFVMRGAAMASRRIRLTTTAPLETLWNTIGWCGRPPQDQSRTFVIVAVGITLCSWIVLPLLLAIAYAT